MICQPRKWVQVIAKMRTTILAIILGTKTNRNKKKTLSTNSTLEKES